MRWLIFSCVLITLSIAGCKRGATRAELTTKFQPTDSFYVMLPEDGRTQTGPVAGSGEQIARGIEAAFKAQRATVERAAAVESQDKATESAQSLGCKYVVRTTIRSWSDNEKTLLFFGSNDAVHMDLDFLEVESAKTLSSINDVTVTGAFVGGAIKETAVTKAVSAALKGAFAPVPRSRR